MLFPLIVCMDRRVRQQAPRHVLRNPPATSTYLIYLHLARRRRPAETLLPKYYLRKSLPKQFQRRKLGNVLSSLPLSDRASLRPRCKTLSVAQR